MVKPVYLEDTILGILFEIPADSLVTFGRSRENSIVVDSEFVSREHHAELYYEGHDKSIRLFGFKRCKKYFVW